MGVIYKAEAVIDLLSRPAYHTPAPCSDKPFLITASSRNSAEEGWV